MSKVPDYLRRMAIEGTGSQEQDVAVATELLLCLVDAVEAQTAVQDDTLHGELVRIADAQERRADALEAIGGLIEKGLNPALASIAKYTGRSDAV